MNDAVIVDGARTPVGKANKGSFAHTRPDDLGAAAVTETLKRSGYEGQVDDIIFGCAIPEAEQGLNVARMIGALSGLPEETPAITINRYCSSGLQAIAYASERIMVGGSETIIAGGTESMSLVPMGGHVLKPNRVLVEKAPEYYMGMGQTAEEVANKYGVTREEQDQFALRSHERAAKAIEEGKFDEEIVPVEVVNRWVDSDNKLQEKKIVVKKDEGIRRDTSLSALGKLKPAFHRKGSVTAGNSSQTSDGAASVLVMNSEKAKSEGLKPLAKFRSFAVAGVPPEIMGIGPIAAVPKALKQAGLSLKDIGVIELNEAFASQSIQVIRELGLNEEIVNINGGAIALGHPMGCTGTKLTLSCIHEMKRRGAEFGLVTMCIGGGMGAAGIFELL
ncbi:3-ketoacyl-CoA thiolase [Scopulibacillus darangshiensis]|uniref:acetyl-CoA C-acyltransferase n=1 Tax=Scopulibacillus darangshiensis TaxID=442528 RepID=A0A4V2SLH7_9BACL|nr:acetyl-CoA C-acetyltransferase [Scopulibacillus darangshiensis]TCP23496.1 3-ketoacyl-CoA thiolase [Scopulibacillus darangshiensis]